MKVAILKESTVDELALRILIDGILGESTASPDRPELMTRSWPGLLQQLRTVFLYLHFHTDANALAIVADSDSSPIHQGEHNGEGECGSECRMYQLGQALQQAQQHLAPRPLGGPLKVAVGLCVPEIAAWYQCGKDASINEAAWINGLASGSPPYTVAQLKKGVFGETPVPFEMAAARAREEARRVAGILPRLEASFPIGFGSFAAQVRSWKA